MVWGCMRMRGLSMAAVALLAGLATPVQADVVEQLLPPEALHGTYDSTAQTLRLTWLPPNNDTSTPYSYTVYRNGLPFGTTNATWYDATIFGSISTFHVTASHNGSESAPSQPMMAQKSGSGGGSSSQAGSGGISLDGPVCEVIGVWTFTSFPFVSITIHEQCIPIGTPTMRGGIPGAGA